MNKSMKRLLSLFMSVLMVSALFVVPAQAIPTEMGNITVYNQRGWGDENNSAHRYDYGNTKKTISSSGCALVAFTNAVKYLNGNYIDPCGLAAYARTHKRPGTNEYYRISYGTHDDIYRAFINDYGSEYNIEYVGNLIGNGSGREQLKSGLEQLNYHLKLGRVAICWIDPQRSEKGHFMTIVDWNPATNQYLLLDSAPDAYDGHCGTEVEYADGTPKQLKGGYAWKTLDELDKIPIAGRFHIIRNRTFIYSNSQCRFTTALDDNRSLDVFGNHSDNGTNIQIWGSHQGGAQRFQLEHVGDGWHKIRHIASGKVLDIEGGYRSSGTNVILWPDNGGYNQLWRFIPAGNGYRIQNRLGTYLDVSGAGTDEGTNVWAYEGNYTDAQLWYTNAQFSYGRAYGKLSF